ncbi:LysR family transcriptional regulator [Aidingimonas lacisalsi]|uniref:LysR family transcriptional regulator n=1 Tax=Aidingimonas lacisalsi TaxID=2604086 RepID=UPI0011D1B0C3|nr:LysR family transcriptional regulator [Aidingimonas lacisalsi]
MHDLDELVAFNSVMETGSLTGSARQLGVVKSTLSRRISQLEDRLGQPLLRRQANRLLPTEAGTLFLAYCQQILRLSEQGQRALDELKEEVSGELAVHVHSSLARSWFARQMEGFTTRYPGVRLRVHTQLTPPQSPEDTSLCLWLGTPPECGLRQEPLGRMTRGVYAHPDYLVKHGVPLHPRELANHDWIDLLGETEKGLVLYHPYEGECHVSLPSSWLYVDQHVLHSDAIARGRGLGIIPDWMAKQRLAHHPGTLTRCLEGWAPSPLPVTLLYPFGHLPRKVLSLLDYLRRGVPHDWQVRHDVATTAATEPG